MNDKLKALLVDYRKAMDADKSAKGRLDEYKSELPRLLRLELESSQSYWYLSHAREALLDEMAKEEIFSALTKSEEL